MKQAKQVFQYGGREEPRQGEEGVAAKRVYGGETMRRLRSVRASLCVCVCVVEGGWEWGVGVDLFFFLCKSQGCSGLTLPLIP